MKPPARRLGRGLGAFLDFGPVGEDGETRVCEVIAQATSVLETSKPAPAKPVAAAPVAPAPRAVPQPTPAPVVAVAPAPPPTAAPALDSSPFVDDVVGGLSFPEVELD